MPAPEDFQILISYKHLSELLQAVEEIPQLRRDLKRNNDQLVALKGMYSALLEKVSELMRYL